MNEETENFLPESNPGPWARFLSSVPTELRTHDTFAITNVYKLNFGKDSTTNQTKPAQSTAKRVQSCRCEVCAVRRASGRGGLVAFACADTGAASWLHLHAQIQARRAGCICMHRQPVFTRSAQHTHASACTHKPRPEA
jgi:hypothetical protein